MPLYKVSQYEIHTTDYEVEAESMAEAIAKVLDDEAEMVDDSQEYNCIAEEVGMPVEGNELLVAELKELGVDCDEIIPSISSVELVEQ